MYLCPEIGINFLTWTVHSMRDKRAAVSLRKNSAYPATGPYTTSTEHKSSGTFQLSTLVECIMDDAVWVQVELLDEEETCDLEGEFNSFSGWNL